jgi:uncharacterized protein (TIGR02996 family)
VTEQEQLLRSIILQPEEDAPRLAYADWLDEQGRHDEATRWRKCPNTERLAMLLRAFSTAGYAAAAVVDALRWGMAAWGASDARVNRQVPRVGEADMDFSQQ